MKEAELSGRRLLCGVERADLVLEGFAGGELVLQTRVKPGRLGPNQDALLALDLGPAGALVALADGMGGLPAGGVAAEVALTTLEATVVETVESGGDLRRGILDGFERGNRAVLDLRAGTGTTLVVVAVQAGAVRVYHVGDSAALLVGQRGRLKHQSTSHSPVGYALEAGLIDENEALHHEERHLVSNALGTTGMHIELGPEIALAKRDTLLVASDGLWDNLYHDEVVETIRVGSLVDAGSELVERCAQRMARTFGAGESARGEEHASDSEATIPSKPDDLALALYRPQASKLKSRRR